MQVPTALAIIVAMAITKSTATPLGSDLVENGNSRVLCTPGEYMCVMYAKDWAGPDEIWTCNSEGVLILSAVCGGRLCCQDSGSGVKCVC